MTTAETTIDLSLQECCDRWGISRNAVKSRAQALGVDLIRESSTRTIWPAADLALGDRLHQHLQAKGATLANFPEALPSPAGGTDTGSAMAPKRSDQSALTAAGATSDQLATVLATVLQAQQLAPPSPLARARALREAAAEGLVLTTTELSQLTGLAAVALERIGSGKRVMGYRLHKLRRSPHDPEQVWRLSDPGQAGFRQLGDPTGAVE